MSHVLGRTSQLIRPSCIKGRIPPPSRSLGYICIRSGLSPIPAFGCIDRQFASPYASIKRGKGKRSSTLINLDYLFRNSHHVSYEEHCPHHWCRGVVGWSRERIPASKYAFALKSDGLYSFPPQSSPIRERLTLASSLLTLSSPRHRKAQRLLLSKPISRILMRLTNSSPLELGFQIPCIVYMTSCLGDRKTTLSLG